MARLLLLATFLFLLATVPTVAAHTTVTTPDGKYFVTVGNLNEPVTTFMKTGLDLIVRANNSGVRGAGIGGLQLTLNATLAAPNGQTLSQPLRSQFGVSGGYSFEEPYFLTLPGSYYLRLTGRINQTDVNFTGVLVGSGPIPSMDELHFPDAVSTPKEIEDRLAALESENDQLRSELAALKQQMQASPRATSPGLGTLVFLVPGALFLAWMRSRRGH